MNKKIVSFVLAATIGLMATTHAQATAMHSAPARTDGHAAYRGAVSEAAPSRMPYWSLARLALVAAGAVAAAFGGPEVHTNVGSAGLDGMFDAR